MKNFTLGYKLQLFSTCNIKIIKQHSDLKALITEF